MAKKKSGGVDRRAFLAGIGAAGAATAAAAAATPATAEAAHTQAPTALPPVTQSHAAMVAQIEEALCIGCQLCHLACWDGAHQCIHLDRVSGAVDGHVEVHAKPHEVGRDRIVVTPIPKLDQPKANVGPYATTLDRIPRVDETECVGCNLCVLVCPVQDCITLVHKPSGVDPRTGWDYARPPQNWTQHPNNPAVAKAAE